MDNSSGAVGEEYTAMYLQKKGYRILERNFHSRYGEIDIIAQNEKYLVFVEVKTREQGSLVSPFEAITAAKQKKIIRTALLFLQKNQVPLQPRFDAAAVTTKNGVPVSIQYITDAFSCGGFF